jgi:hypothetical protein
MASKTLDEAVRRIEAWPEVGNGASPPPRVGGAGAGGDGAAREGVSRWQGLRPQAGVVRGNAARMCGADNGNGRPAGLVPSV